MGLSTAASRLRDAPHLCHPPLISDFTPRSILSASSVCSCTGVNLMAHRLVPALHAVGPWPHNLCASPLMWWGPHRTPLPAPTGVQQKSAGSVNLVRTFDPRKTGARRRFFPPCSPPSSTPETYNFLKWPCKIEQSVALGSSQLSGVSSQWPFPLHPGLHSPNKRDHVILCLRPCLLRNPE